jgi:hypothetical protein
MGRIAPYRAWTSGSGQVAQTRHALSASLPPGKTDATLWGRLRDIATVHDPLSKQAILAHRAGSGAAPAYQKSGR